MLVEANSFVRGQILARDAKDEIFHIRCAVNSDLRNH
jgi:hypothetical protein